MLLESSIVFEFTGDAHCGWGDFSTRWKSAVRDTKAAEAGRANELPHRGLVDVGSGPQFGSAHAVLSVCFAAWVAQDARL